MQQLDLALTEQLLKHRPMLADLHVHLLGTGDVEFWRSAVYQHPLNIDNVLLKRCGITSFSSESVRVAALYDELEGLNNALVLDGPCPDQFETEFASRFLLREWLLRAQPELISELIVWNAARYQSEGVHYVEFSLGTSWLETEFASHIESGIKQALLNHNVIVRLLAAFNREAVSQKIHNFDHLEWLESQWDKKLGHFTQSEHFENHLSKLKKLEKNLEKNQELKSLVVGFDIVGNEVNRPYSPFLLPEFLNLAKGMRNQNSNFGFRLHLGEGVASSSKTGYVALRLGEHLIESLFREGFNVRSGHGIGLAALASTVRTRWSNMYPDVYDEIVPLVERTLKRATVEINLTSNEYLLSNLSSDSTSNDLRDHAMATLLHSGFKVVLGTDDPDIFGDVTLKSEFSKAINNGLIRTEDQLKRIISESVTSSFANEPTKRAVHKLSHAGT